MPITAATKLLGVIGDPISHSLSPSIHNTFIADSGLDLAYLAFPIPKGSLGAFVQSAKTLGFKGFNITMPHKQAILPYIDNLTEQARRGAVNTVKIQEGSLYGHNTDGEGFICALAGAGFEPTGKTALILGRGGAAKTIALSLAEQDMLVSIAARSRDLPFAGNRIRSVLWHDIHREAKECDLLINATPIGMQGQKESLEQEFGDFSFLNGLSAQTLVVDLIYVPFQTQLLQQAKMRGLRVMNGIPMLIHQAALAFEFFTAVKPAACCLSRLQEKMNELIKS